MNVLIGEARTRAAVRPDQKTRVTLILTRARMVLSNLAGSSSGSFPPSYGLLKKRRPHLLVDGSGRENENLNFGLPRLKLSGLTSLHILRQALTLGSGTIFPRLWQLGRPSHGELLLRTQST